MAGGQRVVKKPSFTLRKTPIWGKTDGSLPDFEWPTQEMAVNMPFNVSLDSIEFGSLRGFAPITSIKVNLTHGCHSSEVFNSRGTWKSVITKMNLTSKPIKSVEIFEVACKKRFVDYPTWVKFMDKQGA